MLNLRENNVIKSVQIISGIVEDCRADKPPMVIQPVVIKLIRWPKPRPNFNNNDKTRLRDPKFYMNPTSLPALVEPEVSISKTTAAIRNRAPTFHPTLNVMVTFAFPKLIRKKPIFYHDINPNFEDVQEIINSDLNFIDPDSSIRDTTYYAALKRVNGVTTTKAKFENTNIVEYNPKLPTIPDVQTEPDVLQRNSKSKKKKLLLQALLRGLWNRG